MILVISQQVKFNWLINRHAQTNMKAQTHIHPYTKNGLFRRQWWRWWQWRQTIMMMSSVHFCYIIFCKYNSLCKYTEIHWKWTLTLIVIITWVDMTHDTRHMTSSNGSSIRVGNELIIEFQAKAIYKKNGVRQHCRLV